MNQLNYGSLEACQRLVNAGIVLETETFWSKGLEDRDFILTYFPHQASYNEVYPAPSMAEVWRELPEEHTCKDGQLCTLQMDKIKRNDGIILTSVQYIYFNKVVQLECVRTFFSNINPTDALIDLLIWTRKKT